MDYKAVAEAKGLPGLRLPSDYLDEIYQRHIKLALDDLETPYAIPTGNF